MIRLQKAHMMRRSAIVARMREHTRKAGLLEIEAVNAGELRTEKEAQAVVLRLLAGELRRVLECGEKG